MDKKVIKAMFANIASKDPVRPTLNGVFFDEDCCVATDTHILLVYKETNKKFIGKIMSAEGEEIKGVFPDYKRVFPSRERLSSYPFTLDLKQLQKACSWFQRQPGYHDQDMVVIEGKGLSIKFLKTILETISLVDDLSKAEIMQSSHEAPTVITSPTCDALIMPMQTDNSSVDATREENCPVQISLENLINSFVFESWKTKEIPDPLDWIG